MSTLVSSAPGIFEAFCNLTETACGEESEQTAFFKQAIFGYEPARYVFVQGIENHVFEWEAIGTYQQKEHYSIVGYTTVFSGDSPATNPNIEFEVLQKTYAIFNNTVMKVNMTNGRNMPILNTTGPSPYLMLPGAAAYNAGPGEIDGAQDGWAGRLDFAFNFSALITPA